MVARYHVSRLLFAFLASVQVGGCVLNDSKGNVPFGGPIITNAVINVTDTLALPLDKILYWGAHAAAVYLITDPLAPNWEIEQAAFPDSYYHFSLKMKRLYAGGAGEANEVFHRRAKELMRQGGYDGYQVTEYSESLESSILGSQRVARGVIHLTRS
jgi:hypothetical protein